MAEIPFSRKLTLIAAARRSYSDFYIDSMKIDLTGSVENLGTNANGNWVIEKKYTQTIATDLVMDSITRTGI